MQYTLAINKEEFNCCFGRLLLTQAMKKGSIAVLIGYNPVRTGYCTCGVE
jgi:hypothetical protein